ncbi:MAG: flavodoxin family protein [Bacteroidales bacterium]|nr:flavodoxin family protein [Bacteroidales bacterium]
MNVLMINGSPNKQGNTYMALHEMQKVLEADGVQVNMVHIGHETISGCIGCRKCRESGKCVFNDMVNAIAPLLEKADGLVVGSPVYYASPNASLLALMDRLMFSTHFDKTMKAGASVVVARRGGLSSSFDVLNKYFTISGMPVVSGQYWNSVHGAATGEAVKDAEGMQGMRTLANNMVFLMRSIQLGKQRYGLPEREPAIFTNFIR